MDASLIVVDSERLNDHGTTSRMVAFTSTTRSVLVNHLGLLVPSLVQISFFALPATLTALALLSGR
jgi:hypothetical protein